jgi:hypothetical protein
MAIHQCLVVKLGLHAYMFIAIIMLFALCTANTNMACYTTLLLIVSAHMMHG